MKDEAGWKLVTGDVFRTPQRSRSLAVQVGLRWCLCMYAYTLHQLSWPACCPGNEGLCVLARAATLCMSCSTAWSCLGTCERVPVPCMSGRAAACSCPAPWQLLKTPSCFPMLRVHGAHAPHLLNTPLDPVCSSSPLGFPQPSQSHPPALSLRRERWCNKLHASFRACQALCPNASACEKTTCNLNSESLVLHLESAHRCNKLHAPSRVSQALCPKSISWCNKLNAP